MIIKVSKYSIKSEAAIHGSAIEKLFWRVLKVSQKKPLHEPFISKAAGLHPEIFKKIKNKNF